MIGAIPVGDGRFAFRVWAPAVKLVEVLLEDGTATALDARHDGMHEGTAAAQAGARYLLRLDGATERADPASRWQPDGVHGPSALVDPGTFRWADAPWRGRPLRDFVIAEIHVGTCSPEATFDGAVGYLDELRELGITAVELMPVAQFPGTRNWGYDGVFPFAVQHSYGGPPGLARFVDAAHARGMAVIIDVVYNHVGPEGNHLAEFGPFFTDRYRTPWGDAVNFDGPDSGGVRAFVVENALMWFRDYHVDALRLDAVHGIFDRSATPILRELVEATREIGELLGRRRYLIAESDLNDPRIVTPSEAGGEGIDAQWNDDFHHAIHALLTGERSGYYADFGAVRDLARALADGYVRQGEYSRYRRRRHGASSRALPAERFIVFSQNHDQVGNRMRGDRSPSLYSFEQLKLVAGLVVIAPYIPLLFQGEEYGETAPFLYFVDHGDRDVIEAVRRGRRDEFAAFDWEGDPPDPQSVESFERSRLDRSLARQGSHAVLRDLYRELIGLRADLPALAHPSKDGLDVCYDESEGWIRVRRSRNGDEALMVYALRERATTFTLPAGGVWRLAFDSRERRWGGSEPEAGGPLPGGSTVAVGPTSFVVLHRDRELA
jgi:maltooligosyltrehalose trehalohydrolase